MTDMNIKFTEIKDGVAYLEVPSKLFKDEIDVSFFRRIFKAMKITHPELKLRKFAIVGN